MKYPNLKAEMARNDATIMDVANYLGVSHQTVRNWLKGKSSPSVDAAMMLSKRFGEPIEYLFSQEPIAG